MVVGIGATTPPAINWDTQPNTSATGEKIEWGCADWLIWHKRLAERWGKDRANEVFLQWWNKIQSEVPWYSALTHYQQFCGYNSDFQKYFVSQGLSDIISFIAGVVTPITGGTAEITTKVSDTAVKTTENVADTITKTTGTIKFLLPLAVVGLVGLAGYYLYKNYGKGNKQLPVV